MRLVIADKIIADSASDGLTRWIRAEKPELRLRANSLEIVGAKYARNSSRAWGQYFSFVVTVGRQFPSYAEAEDFKRGGGRFEVRRNLGQALRL